LGMVLHPQFNMHPYVYVVYNYDKAGQYLEKVVRFTYNGKTLINPLIIVDGIIGSIGGNFIHNGSRLVITSDMKLFISTADANILSLPQNNNSLNGKILRVNLDGSIPADNPFHNQVWATGQRNPQGLVYAKGILYSSMHGLTTDDEINIIEKGRNYGWPKVEGFCNLDAEKSFCAEKNVKEPLYDWSPTIAPSGLDYYREGRIREWNNSLLVAILKDKKLIQLKLNGDGTKVEMTKDYFTNQFGRLRDVAVSPEGNVYISTDNGEHKDMIIEVIRR
jgi:glucose/arabinose dehydrogenase